MFEQTLGCPVCGANVMQHFLTKQVNVGIDSVKTNQPNKSTKTQTNHAKDHAVAK